ncbi:heparan-alpha-glucosaminide N-acetyltransferase [Acuticoccus sp. MNP-M23]|uniref:heparan-alpha-glucosaminide N-acetyltransferase n=1 Tax=Acuticoccus sp. MNP-M23 TaxID=3072793 RepID=UPI002816891B|nr:heparan-alpha-glucosaminide N-acetyltransferase [Acuticoccus sp. MNP-M23]WMS43655.1 heparan-alpha-glucosaminide N-acetyltransferase [Acuticoccus sp. MNP-M23]
MAVLSPRDRRALWVDVGRGIAIVAMVAYHFSFDLLYFGFVDWNVTSGTYWRAFAEAIASSFLFLVGVSLVYAHGTRVRWRPFLWRLLLVGGCAALVTIGTTFAMPAPIYFGILHAIFTFSVLALVFLRAPLPITLVVAAAVFAAPYIFTAPAYDTALLYPLGLGATKPFTFDYEPIFPWFSVTLLGVVAGRFIRRPEPGASGYNMAGPFLRAVAAAGRNSLIIYIAHQPVLFALFMLAIAVLGQPAPA